MKDDELEPEDWVACAFCGGLTRWKNWSGRCNKCDAGCKDYSYVGDDE